MMKTHLIWSAALTVLFAPIHGIISLPAVVSDNMVIQQDAPVKLWGWASPQEQIKIELAGQVAEFRADINGNWRTELKPVKSKGPHRMVLAGRNRITIQNILVGEVWICSGQSNMEWPLKRTLNSAHEIADAEFPDIRLFKVARNAIGKPQDNCQGSWSPCNPQAAKVFSAVAYFFGKRLYHETGKPIGLIMSSWGGTPVEGWTSQGALAKVDAAKPVLERWALQRVSYTKNQTVYLSQLSKWETANQKAEKGGAQVPSRPRAPSNPTTRPHHPGSLFNGMIYPLISYPIRGAIWYQGESNVTRAHQYRSLFPAMIHDWRNRWGLGDFPFLFVQIAPFRYGRNPPEMCPELQEAQMMTFRNVPNTGMVVTTDIGNIRDIHPRNKHDVGRRLALWALHDTYGRKDLQPSGPVFKSHRVEGNTVLIEFDYHAGGLTSLDGEPLNHFTIAGVDRAFHRAEVVKIVNGTSLSVSSRRVAKPVAVRFGWRDDAQPNLGNKVRLPASPFRTDKWPGKTDRNK